MGNAPVVDVRVLHHVRRPGPPRPRRDRPSRRRHLRVRRAAGRGPLRAAHASARGSSRSTTTRWRRTGRSGSTRTVRRGRSSCSGARQRPARTGSTCRCSSGRSSRSRARSPASTRWRARASGTAWTGGTPTRRPGGASSAAPTSGACGTWCRSVATSTAASRPTSRSTSRTRDCTAPSPRANGSPRRLESDRRKLRVPIEVVAPPEKGPGDNLLLGEQADPSSTYVTGYTMFNPCGAVDGDRTWSTSA